MKIKYLTLLAATLFAACTKVEVDTPDFEVVTNKTSIKMGEEVTFSFVGDPDQISFFSGEVLKDYAFKDGRVINSNGLNLSFQTSVANGTQANQLSLWASTDFNGVYTLENVKAATWKDITSRFTLATNSTATNAGDVDIKDLLIEGKPIYVAFKYVVKPQTVNGAQRNWTIRNFALKSNTEIGALPVLDQTSAGFQIVAEGNKEAGRSTVTTTVLFRGNATAALKEEHTEEWAISQAATIGSLDLGPDKPIPVKGFVDTKTPEYKYIYQTPGTYTATFVVSNTNIYGAKQIVKQVPITVTAN